MGEDTVVCRLKERRTSLGFTQRQVAEGTEMNVRTVINIEKGKTIPNLLYAMKLAKKVKVPIVPIYFHAKNSKLFYFLASISDTLRTAKLPSELLTQKERTIYIRIGKPISVAMQDEHTDLEDFTEFLSMKLP